MKKTVFEIIFLVFIAIILVIPIYLVDRYNTRQNCELTNKLVYKTKFVTYGFLNLSYKCFAIIK